MKRADRLPLPEPRLLDEPTAAAYLGIGMTRFRMRWQGRELPQPHKDGRRLLWDRKLLDRYVDAISGLDAEPEGWAV